jgi:hypothetical protein
MTAEIGDNYHNDRLARMIAAQKDLQVRVFGNDFREMNTQERVDYIKENVLALTDELHELLAETSWKPWAKSEFLNEERAMSELVDVLHFFMNIAIGIYPWLSPSDIAEVITMGYEKKRGINVQRQEDGYDGVSTKCPECKTALDDPGVESMFINQVPYCVPCGTSE